MCVITTTSHTSVATVLQLFTCIRSTATRRLERPERRRVGYHCSYLMGLGKQLGFNPPNPLQSKHWAYTLILVASMMVSTAVESKKFAKDRRVAYTYMHAHVHWLHLKQLSPVPSTGERAQYGRQHCWKTFPSISVTSDARSSRSRRGRCKLGPLPAYWDVPTLAASEGSCHAASAVDAEMLSLERCEMLF